MSIGVLRAQELLMSAPPVQILGAGLTGMSAAHHLLDDCLIHERLSHPGGLAVTVEEGGFRFDRTGHLLHLRDVEIRRWVEQLLGEEAVTVQRRSRVFSHGVYTRYPYQANTYGLPPQVAYECVHGFLAAQARREQIGPPQNFEEFCLKHFGEGFSKHFMIPYNRKLWGVHPREITAQWASRFVPCPTLQDVIAGAVGLHDKELGYNTEFLYPRRGIGTLSQTLANSLTGRIRYESAPQAIDWRSRKILFKDTEIPYRVLISTIPLSKLLALLKNPPDRVAQSGRELRCNPLYYLDVALRIPCGADIHWAYVPEERYPFYRVGCYSHFSPEMAPPGKACLYVELASREPPDLPKLMPTVAKGLVDMGIVDRPEDIAFVRARHLEHAYVVLDHNYYPCLEQIHPFLEEQHILSYGRYGGWNYSSMEDALIFGREAAAKAKELLS